jgi:hypothetical protein
MGITTTWRRSSAPGDVTIGQRVFESAADAGVEQQRPDD